MRMREGRKKEASKVKQTTRQSNTAHPRQLRKMSCLGWDSNPRHSTLYTLDRAHVHVVSIHVVGIHTVHQRPPLHAFVPLHSCCLTYSNGDHQTVDPDGKSEGLSRYNSDPVQQFELNLSQVRLLLIRAYKCTHTHKNAVHLYLHL